MRQLTDIETELAGEPVRLMPERAMLLPRHGALLIADTHWGKPGTMRAMGVPIPSGTQLEQLDRLASAIERTGAERVIVLGDLFHAPDGVTGGLLERLAERIASLPAPIGLVCGNHDRKLGGARLAETLDTLGVCSLDAEHAIGRFLLTHEPRAHEGAHVIAGHLHPAITLRACGDALKLAAFHLGPRTSVLPAFSPMAAGARLDLAPGGRVFAVAGDQVVAL